MAKKRETLEKPSFQEFQKSNIKEKTSCFNTRTAMVALEGMEIILGMHTDNELVVLCEELGIIMKPSVKKNKRIEHILSIELQGLDDFRRILAHIWDGIIFEYLKSTLKRGKRLRNILDPHRYLLSKWMSDSRHTIRSFGRSNIPITTNRSDIQKWKKMDKIIYDFLTKLRCKEKSMRTLEKKMNEQRNDYRKSLLFFKEVGEIRVLEHNFRNYLMTALLRGRETCLELSDNLKSTQDKYHRELGSHLNCTSSLFRGEELNRVSQQIFFEISFAAETCEYSQNQQQQQLAMDAFIGQISIGRKAEDLESQLKTNEQFTMFAEDVGQKLKRIRNFRIQKWSEVDKFIGAESFMSQLELSVLIQSCKEKMSSFKHRKNLMREKLERARMELEEYHQLYGKKRHATRKVKSRR